MDERLNILSRWVEQTIGAPADLRPASSDASFRRYFRVFCGEPSAYIAMDAPPGRESVAIFARTAAHFSRAGLNVPIVYAMDKTRGFALLSDLGDRTYLQAVREGQSGTLYRDALDALYRLQVAGLEQPGLFEPYDTAKLNAEMELFRQWFVPYRTRCRLSGEQNAIIDRTFTLLTDVAAGQPRVWVHRDYHSRNLMVTAVNNPGVLDFQDAVAGPVTYDLVSLLKDCYIVWPEDRVERWLREYHARIGPHLPAYPGFDEFVRWFDWMGLQRHIKVLGIFSRLHHRDGKADYLGDLPVVYDYVIGACSRYPELRPFGSMLRAMEINWTS